MKVELNPRPEVVPADASSSSIHTISPFRGDAQFVITTDRGCSRYPTTRFVVAVPLQTPIAGYPMCKVCSCLVHQLPVPNPLQQFASTFCLTVIRASKRRNAELANLRQTISISQHQHYHRRQPADRIVCCFTFYSAN